MTFKTLAEYFQKLESTVSRNSMVEILAELFKEASAEEIDKIAYLLQGRVAPMFEPVEFGMAEKTVMKSIALAYGKESDEVIKQFKKTGDIGLVAGGLHRGSRGDQGYRVGQVFDKLYEITQAGGEGSVEKKISLLCELLQGVDSTSAKYIARIPVDKLRLGFSDMTMLEGLSWMVDGTKKHKGAIEAAYNIRPDLGFIAGVAKSEGIGGFVGSGGKVKIKPKVGTPILVMRAERLTNAQEIIDKGQGAMAVEPKVDGFRLQLHYSKKGLGVRGKGLGNKIRLYSRGMEHVTTMYPDIIEAVEKEIHASEVILDGEAIGFNPKTGKFLPFQETSQRRRKYDIDSFAKDIPLKYIVFDCLFVDGRSLIDETYEERRKRLEKLLGDKGNQGNRGYQGRTIVAVEMEVVQRPEDLEKIFQVTLKKGLEGIMAKRLDGVYQAGARGWNWIKLKGSYTGKLADTIDAVVMGIDYGQGARAKFGVGSFLVGVYDQKSDSFKTVSKIGTGLTDEEWHELKVQSEKLKVKAKPQNYEINKLMDCDVWLRPKLVGEFRADELTRSPMHTAGYALRFPRLVQWREKNPEDSTSIREIEEMVKLQKH